MLPNFDFVSAEQTLRVGRERSPLELGLGWLVDFEKGISPAGGRCSTSSERGPRRRLVGLDIEGNKPAHNALLYADEGRQARGRQRHFRHLVADLQAQHRACHGRCTAFLDGRDDLGGYLLESRTCLGAPHVRARRSSSGRFSRRSAAAPRRRGFLAP